MTLPRSIELQWQKEVIERWLKIPEITLDGREPLLEMLRVVAAQLEGLSMSRRNVARKIRYQRLTGPEVQKWSALKCAHKAEMGFVVTKS